jgi:hypothetical protein
MTAGGDWTLRVFDHVDLNTSDYTASVRFYETVLSPLGIPKIAEHEQGTWVSAWTDFTKLDPDGNNVEACTATSETSATVKVRRCTDHL